MARIRSVKPDLRISRVVASWPVPARYAWVLLWGYLDDFGRGIDDVRLIVADCFPSTATSPSARWRAGSGCMRPRPTPRSPPLSAATTSPARATSTPPTGVSTSASTAPPSRIPPCPIHEALTDSLSESLSEDSVSDSLRARKEMEVGDGDGGGDGSDYVAAGADDGAAQPLIAEWIDHCSQRPQARHRPDRPRDQDPPRRGHPARRRPPRPRRLARQGSAPQRPRQRRPRDAHPRRPPTHQPAHDRPARRRRARARRPVRG